MLASAIPRKGLPVDLVKDEGKPAILHAPPALDMREGCAWLAAIRAELRAGLDVEGAVLIRGLPVRDTTDFALVRDAITRERAHYREQATPRTSFGDDIYSSTDFPVDQRIMPHNENSYTLEFPGLLLFGCLVPAEHGGATPVADCRKVFNAIPQEMIGRFRAAGWGLIRNYTDYFGLGWRTAFGTQDPVEVMRYCAENKIGASWEAGGRLQTVQRRSAIIRHPRLGQEVWFNHVAFWNVWSLAQEFREALLGALTVAELPYNTVYGDGQPLTAQEIGMLLAAYDSATVRVPWQSGDIMVVDNILAAHGRDSYRGRRTVLVAMGEAVKLHLCAPTVEALPRIT